MADILRVDWGLEVEIEARWALGGYRNHLRWDKNGDREGSEMCPDSGYMLMVEKQQDFLMEWLDCVRLGEE